LGKPGEHDTEIHAILAEYGLPSEFPIEVETYNKKLIISLPQAAVYANRRDADERDLFIMILLSG
jgi:ribonuclease R